MGFRHFAWKRTFKLWQRLGLHVTPNNYYFPIPDTRELRSELWSRQSSLVGIDTNEQGQLSLLSAFETQFKKEYDSLPLQKDTEKEYVYFIDNPTFGSVDGEVLYSFIRFYKPRRIIEVGSGYSTLLESEAIMKNTSEDSRYKCELTTIDPNPPIYASGLPNAEIVVKKVQDVPLSKFTELGQNDILFLDSSHCLSIGSDVQWEYLEILPRLNPGVIIHVHDIFMPSEYPRDWVLRDYRFWNEQYLLQAFMTFNRNFEILWMASYMHLKHPEKLAAAFASYRRDRRWPGSFWMRRMK